jgi:hypothetical protein
VAMKKNIKTAAPAAPIAKTATPNDKLKIITKAKDDDWYQAAVKRFSISQNRIDTRRDYSREPAATSFAIALGASGILWQADGCS